MHLHRSFPQAHTVVDGSGRLDIWHNRGVAVLQEWVGVGRLHRRLRRLLVLRGHLAEVCHVHALHRL